MEGTIGLWDSWRLLMVQDGLLMVQDFLRGPTRSGEGAAIPFFTVTYTLACLSKHYNTTTGGEPLLCRLRW